MPRWIRRPEGSTWGDFGPDDQAGRLNLLTPQKVRQGLAEAREGLSFCLSLPLDCPGGNGLNPRRFPPELRPTRRGSRANFNVSLAPDHTDVVSDDLAVLHLQYSTQWDALAHVGSQFDADGDGVPEPVYYNGYRAGEHVVGPAEEGGPSAARALGIERMAERCVQGRAVMVDLRGRFGDGRRLVGYDDLRATMEADGASVEPGDMLCLHTGFADRVLAMGGAPDAETLHGICAALDGRDRALLRWITDSGISVIAADNYAVEAFPAGAGEGCCAALPLHEHCLFKLGVHLGELWHLTPLAEALRARGRSRFLLTAPPLRLPGAVGSPVTPVGTI